MSNSESQGSVTAGHKPTGAGSTKKGGDEAALLTVTHWNATERLAVVIVIAVMVMAVAPLPIVVLI